MTHPDVPHVLLRRRRSVSPIDPVGIDAVRPTCASRVLGDSFVASVNQVKPDGSMSAVVSTSPDGRDWTPLNSPPSGVEGFGAVGDRLVVTGYDYGGTTQVITVREPSGAWITTAMNTFVLSTDGMKASMGGGSIAIRPTASR